MNAAILIASRELRDRGRLFLIAACLGLVPFTAVFAVRENRHLAIATVTGFVAAAYTAALALAMGVSMIGRDLTEKRLSFLFTKPVSAASIWFGKVTAGILTWLGAFVIVILPTFVFAHRGWTDMWTTGGGAISAFTLIISTILFFAGHGASTVLRSRSALVAVDFALAVLLVIAMFGITRPILLGGGLDVVVSIALSAGVALLVVLAIAPVWQIARGRIDPRHNHAAFSAAFWSGAALIVAVAAAYALWVISPPLSSITDIYMVDQSPSGKWMYVSGQTENRGSYLASFLVDPATGERERVPVSPWGAAHRTPDGQTLAWFQFDSLLPQRGAFRLYTRRLGDGGKAQPTQLVMSMPRNAELSADGSRFAVTRSDKLEVYELPTGRLLGVAPGLKVNDVAAMYFAGPDVVRVVEMSRVPNTMILREFDLKNRKLTSSPPRPTKGTRGAHFSADGSRVYVRTEGVVLDARTGAVLVTQPVTPARMMFGSMLRDGSTVVTRDSKLYHYDVNGAPVAEIAIPVRQAMVMGELGASKLLLSSGGNNPADWRSFVVDLSSKKVEAVTPGVRIPFSSWFDSSVPRFTDDATLMVMEGQRKLMLWDPRTGATRPFPV